MTKYILGVIAGVFVAAFALELLDRKSPGLLSMIRDRARGTAKDLERAFVEGYRQKSPAEERIEARI